MRFRPTLSFAVAAFALATSSLSGQATGRPFSIDDVLRMHRIGPVSASPDGDVMVVTVTRPALSGDRFLRQSRQLDRTDLWLVSRRDGTVRKLTDGFKTQTGYSSASWAPDGSRMAYYAVTGDG